MSKKDDNKDKKPKKAKITFKKCRKTKRADGLKMKCVMGYTFPDFVNAVSSRWPKRVCYSIYGHDEDGDMTFSQLSYYSRAVASYLLSKDYKKGDKVAIFAESCPNWMVMYLGITYIGAIAVPILPDFTAREAEFILKDSEAKGVLVNAKSYQKIKAYKQEKPELDLFRAEDLINIHEIPEGYMYLNSPGFSMKDAKVTPAALSYSKPEEDDVASIIYTSGTTGTSKGVVLTHKNLLRCADLNTDVYVKIKPGYNVLSILPMSHVYEFTIGQLLTLLRGCHITFLGKPPAVSILLPALKSVRPEIMLTVPLLIEKVYKAAIVPVINGENKIKKLLKGPFKSYVYKMIGRKLKNTFGGNLKFFGIGGAALDREVEEFLYKAHFPYSIGYGLTETSPLVAGGGPRRRDQRPGWIGKVVIDDDVKLLNKREDGVGEIAVKGVNVMKGYYKNEELNREAFTEDGYFRTGDLGLLDKKNRLAIKGRVKTMILGPAGENIYPESIESLINNLSFVQESLVVPENGGLLALIKIDLQGLADKMAISIDEAKEEAKKYIASIRKEVNSQLSAYSKIDEVKLQEEDFERTPTQKIKRFLYPKKNKKDEDKK